nr:unnamed protein product [Callosobruchus analis]CAI5842202.1 unnamed protein product [Callosobruchus analis]
MLGNCPNCEVKLDTSRDTSVICDGCKSHMHTQCIVSSTGLSKDDISRITRNKARTLKFMCKRCDGKLAQLLNIQEIVKAETSRIFDKISALENRVNDISAGKCSVNVSLSPLQFEEIICEMNERNIRKRNIVIFNLEEKSPNLDKDQRISLERN